MEEKGREQYGHKFQFHLCNLAPHCGLIVMCIYIYCFMLAVLAARFAARNLTRVSILTYEVYDHTQVF
jgi:hypothetical protein